MKLYLLKISLSVALLLAATVVQATGSGQQIVQAGTQLPFQGSAQFFTGTVKVEPLFPHRHEMNASGAYVTFQPKARSAWHTHPKGQHIVVTAGVGLTQEWGKPIRQLKPGDVVWCPPGVKHWHGATSQHEMTHLVVTGHDNEGNNVVWLEKVSDPQYQSSQVSDPVHP